MWMSVTCQVCAILHSYSNTHLYTAKMPLFSKETLMKLTVAMLTEISKKYNITRLPKKKEDIAEKIHHVSKMLNQECSALDQLLVDIASKTSPDPSPCHNFYKANFNMDDLNDRKWYAVEEHHPNHHWQGKMLIALMRFMVYDAWVVSTRTEYELWLEWHEKLAKVLVTRY